MHGNVWEWCEDWDGNYLWGAQVDPQGPSSGESRVLRGGYFTYYAQYVRSAARSGGDPGLRSDGFGFRLLRTE